MATYTVEEQVQQLYVGLLGRPADATGFNYWVEEIKSGTLTLEEVRSNFVNEQPEGQAIYESGDRVAIVQQLYSNLFDRVPAVDDEGFDYWVNGEGAGVPADLLVYALINGAGADDRAAMDANVAEAQAATDADGEEPQEPSVPGETVYLGLGADRAEGTDNDDTFVANLNQSEFAGNVANTLASGDMIDGKGGNDTLEATLTNEASFYGIPIDVQPTISNVEDIKIEARDGVGFYGENGYVGSNMASVDAKDIADVDHIGSHYSDGDLYIENVTTLTNSGQKRNTEEVTVTMDHTDNFNSDGDASDLMVYFDDNYLLAGQSRTTSQANYWLLDEDSQDYQTAPLLNIERFGVSLNLDGEPVNIAMPVDVAEAADTWEAFAAGLQAAIDQQVADGNSALEGLSVVVDRTNTDATYNDFGNLVTIPAITIIDSLGRELEPTGFLSPEDATGAFDIYGDFDNQPSQQLDKPVTVNVDLHKVGRGGEGGNLVVGGKSQSPELGSGIEVFNIDVLGDASKPSSLGQVVSTNDTLKTVNIATADEYVAGESHASLTIRGEGQYQGDQETPFGGTVDMINATQFLGDLTIGNETAAQNVNTLNATGGGDVEFHANLNESGSYNYVTGAGADVIRIETVDGEEESPVASLNLDTGSNDDVVMLQSAALAGANVKLGAGDDVIYVGNTGARGSWDATVDADQLPQVLYGAQVAVTFSSMVGLTAPEASGWNNGFESVVDIALAPGDFFGSAADVNKAIVRAINEDSVLSNLMSAAVTPAGAVEIKSKVDGEFAETDLEIQILEAQTTDQSDPRFIRPGQQEQIAEALQVATNNSQATFSDALLAAGEEPVSVAVDEEGVGSASSENVVINAGAGDDLVVLSNQTTSTLQFTEYGNGFDSIVNYSENEDILDFQAYLTSKQEGASGSVVSQSVIDTGVNLDGTLEANHVSFVTFTAAEGQAFGGITTSNLLAALNEPDNDDFGSIGAGTSLTAVDTAVNVGDSYKAVLMVEHNTDNGAYQAWEVSVGVNADGATIANGAQLIGTYDFGNSLTGLQDAGITGNDAELVV